MCRLQQALPVSQGLRRHVHTHEKATREWLALLENVPDHFSTPVKQLPDEILDSGPGFINEPLSMVPTSPGLLSDALGPDLANPASEVEGGGDLSMDAHTHNTQDRASPVTLM